MKKLALLLFILPLLHACKKEPKISTPPLTVTDVDGNVYKTVKIGTQTWMVENLKTTHYSDGIGITTITNGNDVGVWPNNTTGAYCDYGGDANNAKIYGHLYNWYAVANTKHLAPIGWHIPTPAEFSTLFTYLSANGLTASQMSDKLRETTDTYWLNNNGATNSTGFKALSGGTRAPAGMFNGLTADSFFWLSTQANASNGDIYEIKVGGFNSGTLNKNQGCSIRCIKD